LLLEKQGRYRYFFAATRCFGETRRHRHACAHCRLHSDNRRVGRRRPSAHHGWGSYDATKVFIISGPVETLAWATHIRHPEMHDNAGERNHVAGKSVECAEPARAAPEMPLGLISELHRGGA